MDGNPNDFVPFLWGGPPEKVREWLAPYACREVEIVFFPEVGRLDEPGRTTFRGYLWPEEDGSFSILQIADDGIGSAYRKIDLRIADRLPRDAEGEIIQGLDPDYKAYLYLRNGHLRQGGNNSHDHRGTPD
jgi:hypothetical protein